MTNTDIAHVCEGGVRENNHFGSVDGGPSGGGIARPRSTTRPKEGSNDRRPVETAYPFTADGGRSGGGITQPRSPTRPSKERSDPGPDKSLRPVNTDGSAKADYPFATTGGEVGLSTTR